MWVLLHPLNNLVPRITESCRLGFGSGRNDRGRPDTGQLWFGGLLCRLHDVALTGSNPTPNKWCPKPQGHYTEYSQYGRFCGVSRNLTSQFSFYFT